MADIHALSLDGNQIVLKKAIIKEFEGQLKGSLLLPEHTGYDEGRSVWNGMIDHRPACIVRLIDINQNSPSPHSTLDIWQLGGAMSRIEAEESAFGDRSAPFLLGIEANWEDPAADDANIAWARQAYGLMEPFSTGAEYLNFPGLYEERDQMIRQSFGKNYKRLVELKNKYDPTNFLRLNQNVKATTYD